MSTKKIKIIHLITGLGIGGAEAALRDLVLGIDRDRFESVVVSIQSKREIADQIEPAGIRVIYLNGVPSNGFGFFSLIKVLRDEKPDMLHTQLFHADIMGRLVGFMMRVPKIISTLQNVTFGGRLREWLLVLTRGMVDEYVAVSKIVLDHTIKLGIARKEKSHVIYNAVDVEKYKPVENRAELRNKLGIDVTKKIIVSTGRLIEQKGFPYLMEAMRSLYTEKRMQDIQLIILGEGCDRSQLEHIQKSFPKDLVVLAGAVLNVVEYLQAADIFVMSSVWEGCSVALIEAGAVGLPVVATPVGVAPELIVDSHNGILVPIRDTDALVHALYRLLTMSEQDRGVLGKSLHHDVMKRFSATTMVHDYETLFIELKK